jgi:ADP-ribose pyrophosphatase
MTHDRMNWGPLERTLLADYGIFRVSRKNGISPRTQKPVEFHCIESSDWVQVVSITTDQRLVMVEQFRPGAEVKSLEFPAGMLDADEQPERAAARELAEETGYCAAQLLPLGWIHPNPAINSNRLHLWLALDCELAGALAQDDREDIRVKLIEPADFETLRARGVINHAMVVTAWYIYGSWRSQRPASRT